MKKISTQQLLSIYLSTTLFLLHFSNINAQYTLTDDDVVVENGIITSCSYDFDSTNIVIPEILDGQTVTGIKNITFSSLAVFYNKGITSVSLPSTLTDIGANAFYYNKIDSISLPASIENIGYHAFQSNRIKKLDLSNCTVLKNIGYRAFYDNQITDLDLSNCTSLLEIGTEAFRYNNSLTSFLLPEVTYDGSTYNQWVDKNGNNYTAGVTDATNFSSYYFPVIYYTLTNEDVVVQDGIITSCYYESELSHIIIPETLDGQTITGIKDGERNSSGVFYQKGIISVTLPSTIKTIGNYAFYNEMLYSLTLPDSLISIGHNAFYSNNIKELDFSKCLSLEKIDNYAFAYNQITSLDLTMLSKLEVIGLSAFYNNDITDINLSSCSGLLEIQEQAFYGNQLTSFLLPEVTYQGITYNTWLDGYSTNYTAGLTDATNFETFYIVHIPYTLTNEDVIVEEGLITSCSYDYKLKNIVIPETLDGQTVIGIKDGSYSSAGIFYWKGITTVELPSTFEHIGAYAFYGNKLTSVSIPENVLKIGTGAFQSNTLTSINLTSPKLQLIEESAFYGNSLSSLDLSACNSLLEIQESAFYNNSLTSILLPEVLYEDNTYTIWTDNSGKKYTAELTDVTDFSSFYVALINYTLGDDDVVVEDSMIISCSYDFQLKNIIIPEILDGQTVKGIKDGAYWSVGVFYEKGIVSLALPSTMEIIGDNAFYKNNLTSLSFPENVTSIGNYAFGLNKIIDLDFKKCTSLNSIDYSAFQNNDIDTIDLNSCPQLKKIGSSAFRDNNIISLDLSNNIVLDTIDRYAFYSNNLSEVNLINCNNLIEIGKQAFDNNTLTEFELPNPNISGYILDYWLDGNSNKFIAGDTVVDLSTNYTAYTLQFSQNNFFAEFLSTPQTINRNLKFFCPERGIEITDISFMNSSIEANETLPKTITLGDTTFSFPLSLTYPETNLYKEYYQITYVLDSVERYYSDTLDVAIIFEDSSELSFVGKKAIEAYNVCVDSNDVAEKNNKGVIYRLLGDFDKAEETLNTAVSEAIENFYGYDGIKMNQAVVCSDQKNSSGAMDRYSTIVTDITENEDSSTIAPRIYYNQAWEHFHLGEFTDTKTKALATIAHQKSNNYLKAKAYVLLGVNEVSLEDTLSAIKYFEEAVDIAPESYIANMAGENIMLLTNADSYECITICQGEDYNGFTESGHYTLTLQSGSGKDSTVALFLTINPIYTISLDTTICEGESYNGWSETGLYSQSLVSSCGCDSTINVNLIVTTCTGIENEELNQFSVYPNPNNGSFILSFDKAPDLPARIEILNTLGTLIYSEILLKETKEHRINMVDVPKGLYLIIIQEGNKKIKRQIIIN